MTTSKYRQQQKPERDEYVVMLDISCVSTYIDVFISVWIDVCLLGRYLSMLHYNQPFLVENCNSLCTAMPHNSTGLILHQDSKGPICSITHVLLMVKEVVKLR